MKTYIIDYVVGNTYKVKKVKAESVKQAIKKARVKSIVDINIEEHEEITMKGFTLTAKGKDYFFATNLKNKTKSLAKKIIRSLNGTGEFDIPDNVAGIDAVMYSLQRAECEIRTLSNGNQYYEIHGDGFGGRGSFVDDGKTVVLTL